MRFIFWMCVLLAGMPLLRAQQSPVYQRPPAPLVEMVDAAPTPAVFFDAEGTFMIQMARSTYPEIAELAEPELRLAGLRIDPERFGPSRTSGFRDVKITQVGKGLDIPVSGLPLPLRASAPVWNPSQTHLAFTHTSATAIDLYEVEVRTGKARKVNSRPLQRVLGSFGYVDDRSLFYLVAPRPASAAPALPSVPAGPVIQENMGPAAPVRTFQDLLSNAGEEALFRFYAQGQLVIAREGKEKNIGTPQAYSRIQPSPDGRFWLAEILTEPFSYQVQVFGFPRRVVVMDREGKTLRELANLPSSETSPSGFDNIQDVPRGFQWRSDAVATVYWAQPLDGGLMKNAATHRDAVYQLAAPFEGPAAELARTEMRYRGILWGEDSLALLLEGLRGTQRTRTSRLNPRTGALQVLIDRSTNDRYGDPGSPLTRPNQWGRPVLQRNAEGGIWLSGDGASPDGDLPFLALLDVNSGQSEMRWRCEPGFYENVILVQGAALQQFITLRQSPEDPPQYMLRNLAQQTLKPLTDFPDPQPLLRQLQREKIQYRREDGVDLTATVYLPPGYTPERDGRLPLLVWAYPREYRRAADAAQVRGSQFNFTRLNWGSPVYYALLGYAVMDATEFPIVGEGEQLPNDNFVEQLIWNAEAALRAAHDRGWGDTTRAAVGGHSYGAFMTANLLAHSRLFKAGIARSGAYMRYLTPFGFQNEERTYWEAPELYYQMSPFSFAHQIKDALLLVHGEADNNPGTFPINSERLFQAVKGHGGKVRYVSLPHESHSYAARESILHMLWEQHQWLERFLR